VENIRRPFSFHGGVMKDSVGVEANSPSAVKALSGPSSGNKKAASENPGGLLIVRERGPV
jgi:hypothetical protein